jgi:hypothetical protein
MNSSTAHTYASTIVLMYVAELACEQALMASGKALKLVCHLDNLESPIAAESS